MTPPAPPRVFDPVRRMVVRRRADALAGRAGAARYLLDDMVEDVLERIAFLRHEPRSALIIGDRTATLAAALTGQGCNVRTAEGSAGWDEEQPFPQSGFDLVVSLSALDTLNDPVGALIHMRGALAPGGLALASLCGAGCLPVLRAAMFEADGDRPAPRLHPMIDIRGAAPLLQRAGWANPVVDNRSVQVRYSSLASLVADLRAQGLSNCLARRGPPLTRAQVGIASAAFGAGTVETFEILTLTGWRT